MTPSFEYTSPQCWASCAHHVTCRTSARSRRAYCTCRVSNIEIALYNRRPPPAGRGSTEGMTAKDAEKDVWLGANEKMAAGLPLPRWGEMSILANSDDRAVSMRFP